MNPILEQMLRSHEIYSTQSRINSIKEVVQEVVLYGLSRAGFFKSSAFYGGTALRIFHGLDRFSEDLDFSLKIPDVNFDFSSYFSQLENELKTFGLNFRVETKCKVNDSDIKSAFVKGNTLEHLLLFNMDSGSGGIIGPKDLIKIKFEVDTNPPENANFEIRYQLLPIPYEITLYDMSSLFAGKVHAVLARSWASRVKGRDLYDFVFYISRGVALNVKHLEARLKQTKHLDLNKILTLDDAKMMLCEKFNQIDYAQAKLDVLPFIKNGDGLDVWSSAFFCEITKNLK